jgi:hypothetical protein
MIFGVKSKITKCIDDEGYPSFVECEFTDAHGTTHQFQDKDVIFTSKTLDKESNYPVDGIIDCEIIDRKNDGSRILVTVSTELPWHVESVKHETVFEVLAEQIVEIEHHV